MEKTKENHHTPGPWIIRGQRIEYGPIVAGDGWCVATISRDPAEAEANARLIAAAPDLLATLEKVANCSRYPMNEPENMAHALNTLRELARFAIAKAEGRD